MYAATPKPLLEHMLDMGFKKSLTKGGTPCLRYQGQSGKRGVLRIFADEVLLQRETHAYKEMYATIIASIQFKVTKKNHALDEYSRSSPVVDVQMFEGGGYLVNLFGMDNLKICDTKIYHSNIFWEFRAANAICLINETALQLKDVVLNTTSKISVSSLGCVIATYPNGSPKTCQSHGYKCPCRN